LDSSSALRILVLVERGRQRPAETSLRVVVAAREVADRLGAEVEALVPKALGTRPNLDVLARFGVDRAWVGRPSTTHGLDPVGRVRELVALVGRTPGCFALLAPCTPHGAEVAARVAARVGVPLVAGATALDVKGGELIITRPILHDQLLAEIVLEAAPRIITVQPAAFVSRKRPRTLRMERLPSREDPPDRGLRLRRIIPPARQERTAPGLGQAPIVVSGGRGIQGPENWALLEDLRQALGPEAVLGASRVAVDAGWRPRSEQVGQTGTAVAPRLYFAIGISGSIQHRVGISKAGTIVAVNRDPDAPIFRMTDYGIVGDALEVVPRLAAEIRRVRCEAHDPKQLPDRSGPGQGSR
jgi:electron transfer flavoprotein alpha subunit